MQIPCQPWDTVKEAKENLHWCDRVCGEEGCGDFSPAVVPARFSLSCRCHGAVPRPLTLPRAPPDKQKTVVKATRGPRATHHGTANRPTVSDNRTLNLVPSSRRQLWGRYYIACFTKELPVFQHWSRHHFFCFFCFMNDRLMILSFASAGRRKNSPVFKAAAKIIKWSH